MKILIISGGEIPVPPIEYGGTERIAHNLCNSLMNRRFHINLLAGKGSKIYSGKTLNYRNYRFGTSFLGRCYSWIECQTQCMRLIQGVDLIHSFVCWPEHFYFLNKIKKPILYRQANTPKKSDFERIMKVNPSYGYLQCISNHQISQIEITDPKKAFVTYNCVDTDFFKKENINKEDFLLYLGRLNYEKGIDVAVRLSRESGVPLKIAGPVRLGEKGALKLFKESVEPFLSDHIEYVGSVNDLEKRSLLSKAKALIVPNRWDEPFGIMNIEALACGTPIIATNKGSLREIIIEGKTGILCDNYGELLDAIKNVDHLSEKCCRKDAEERFSLNTYIDQTEKIYKVILKGE